MPTSVCKRSGDNANSGAFTTETVLTAEAVRARGLTRLFSMLVPDDPRLEAQPLLVAGLAMADGRTRNVCIQASMANSVHAFDADTGASLWQTTLGRAVMGSRAIDAWGINIRWGILSTPVIDEAAGLLYCCAWISADGTAANAQHFLAAIHLGSGALAHPLLNLEGAVYVPPGGLTQQQFRSAERKQRAGLVISQGAVLVGFGTVSETATTARGWLIAVDTAHWAIAACWCSTVTGHGGGLWQSGASPAVDAKGDIYVITGNGDFDPEHGDYGECVVQLRYAPAHGPVPGSITVAGWWPAFSDAARVGEMDTDDAPQKPTPSNVRLTTLAGHAHRLGIRPMPGLAPKAMPDHDPALAAIVESHMDAMADSAWGDQDFGSGGPVLAEAEKVVLAAGKDGILYSVRMDAPGNVGVDGLAQRANYAALAFPPILYTYYDPGMQPAPVDLEALNHLPGNATRHLHGTPLLWRSATHGPIHFVGGENSNLRAWTLGADGSSTFLAQSNELASPNSPRPPGGMPGWSIALAADGDAGGIVIACVPWADANMALSAGRLLVYDAQTLTTLWDSAAWGPEHDFTHPKFNRPVPFNGRIYRPTYDGRIDVYGLA